MYYMYMNAEWFLYQMDDNIQAAHGGHNRAYEEGPECSRTHEPRLTEEGAGQGRHPQTICGL